MSRNDRNTGFAIALAWPQTYCKQPGAWYDPITLFLGVNHNNYYKVGHAALVLIDIENKSALYYDFGRYHAPYKHGRVRSAETDHDLRVNTIPFISEDKSKLENFSEILNELQNNAACHGEGELHASYCSIDFKKANSMALQMQEESPIPYGPFIFGGSNCSRFVYSSIMAGRPKLKHRIKLKYKVPLTPTPISNVNALNEKKFLPKFLQNEPFCPIKKLNKQLLSATLPIPEKHPSLPESAQWLSGEGAGSWFAFDIQDSLLKVTRYSPEGTIECTGLYENKEASHILKESKYLSITYPSNCRTVSLKFKETELRFHRAI